MKRAGIAAAAPLLLGGACLASAAAMPQAATRSLGDGVYSEAQAARGKQLYGAQCASCHGGSGRGSDSAPPVAGAVFLGNWRGQSAADLARRIRQTMPADAPGTLGTTATSEIMAFMFQLNGFPAGPADLPASASALRGIRTDSGS